MELVKLNQSFSAQLYARIGGLAYLVIIVTGALGELYIRSKLVVPGNPAATAGNIQAFGLLWRLGIAGDLLMHICDLVLSLVYYSLFKNVNKNLALLSLFFGIIQTAVLVANKLNLVMPLLLLNNQEYLTAFTQQQLQVWSLLAIKAHDHGFAIGLVFFGCACLIDGWLMFYSGFLPKALGILIAVTGLAYLVNSFTLIVLPAQSSTVFPILLGVASIGELSVCLWLLIKGINLKKWEQLQY